MSEKQPELNHVKKGNVIDAFIVGAKDGMNISLYSVIPNVLLAFALTQFLTISGLMEIIGNVLQPVMAIFGLPGVAATVLMGAFMSMGAGIGVLAGLLANGDVAVAAVPILMPAIYLMGSQIQFMGRIAGNSGLPSKYHGHVIVISVINALLSMLVMRIFF